MNDIFIYVFMYCFCDCDENICVVCMIVFGKWMMKY